MTTVLHTIRNCGALYRARNLADGLLHFGGVRASDAALRELRDRHAGRVGVVVGNGPSLAQERMEDFSGVVTIASNKIHLLYARTEWRPTYYTCVDKLVWEKIQETLGEASDRVFVPNTLKRHRTVVPTVTVRNLGSALSDGVGFSTDLLRGAFGGWTVTYFNLQFAAHLGCDPIILIGCDHFYTGEQGASTKGERVVSQGQANHFSADYRKPGEVVNSAPIELMNASFEKAAAFARRTGVRILNGTRGGYLECFPRVQPEERGRLVAGG